jgi:hypothetical protein
MSLKNQIAITKTLIHHAALIFQQLPAKTPDHTLSIAPQQILLQSLLPKFDRKAYLVAAKSLNIPDKTTEKQVERYLNANLIESISHGVYRKR